MKTYNLLIKNILSNWFNIIINSLIGFFMMPFMIRYLGDDAYGVWILIVSLVGYGIIFDMGIRNSIIKYVAEYYIVNDYEKLNKLFSSAIFVYTIVCMILIFISVSLSSWLIGFFNLKGEMQREAEWAALIIFVWCGIKFPLSVFEGFLCGKQRYDIYNGNIIVSNLIRAILIVVLMKIGYGLIALSLISVGAETLGFLMNYYFFIKHFKKIHFKIENIEMEVLKEFLSYGIGSLAIIISLKVIYESGPIIIGIIFPVSAVTYYAIGNNLVRYMRQFGFGFGNVFNPVASVMEAKSEDENIRRLIIHGIKFSLLVVLPMGLTFIILGEKIIFFWIGEKYAEIGGQILLILAISQIFAVSQFSTTSVLFGLKKHKILAVITSIEAIVTIILSILLGGRLGIIGIALGLAIPEIVVNLFVVPWYILSKLKINFYNYLKDAIMPAIICGSIFVVSLIIMKVLCVHNSLGMLLFEISVGMVIYIISVIIMGINGEERKYLSIKFHNVISKLNQAEI